jgi:hypothetical protein
MTALAPTELLPCPFCGGAATYDTDGEMAGGPGERIVCLVCDAQTVWLELGNKEASVKAWNTRQAVAVERAEVAGEAVRLRDAELSLAVWDHGRESEYWLRYPDAQEYIDAGGDASNPDRGALRSLASPPRSEGVRGCEVIPPDWKQDQAETTRIRPRPQSEVRSAEPVAWIDFADNGNIRFWTSEDGRAAVEKALGRNLRMFTLVELVALAARNPAQASWMPIETAPRDGTRILARGGALDDIEIVSYSPDVGAWATPHYTLDDRDDEPDGYNRPRFWMPIPGASSVPSASRGTEA